MKLDGVNQLPIAALDHHLVAAEIRRGEQLESFRNSIELQPVVLPDAENPSTPRLLWISARDVLKDRIVRIRDADEPILILVSTSLALLVLLELVERHDSRAETQTHQLVTATDRENRNPRCSNEPREIGDYRFLVVIKIAQRSAEHDRVGLKALGGLGEFRHMGHLARRPFHQARNVVDDILDRHAGDVSLATELRGEQLAPLLSRYGREVAVVAQQIVDDEHARFLDALLHRFIPTIILLVEWEGKRIQNLRGVGGQLLSH